MQLSQMLDNLMSDRGISAYKISKDTGISDRLIGYWRNGEKLPGAENLLTIANYFNISVDYLLTGKERNSSLSVDEQELLDNYRCLSERDKGKVSERAQTLYDIAMEQAENIHTPIISLRHSLYMVSAGTGYELDSGDSWDEIEVPDTPTARKADVCLTISGDSMEPRFHNGDIVLVKHCNAIDENEIGIFRIENKGYIKRYGLDRLISLNPKYDDILFSDYDSQDIQCLGLVIGKA